jgi:thioredoxin-related protein
MNKLLTALLAVSILFLAVHGKALAANGDTAAGKAVSKAPYASTQKQQTLLFFINPYGRPCQTQDAILKGMAKQLAAYNAKVKYIKTTEMESAQPYFRKYGVRALPMIIVLDENGAVKKRFPPGIQNQFALAAALE